MNKYIIKNCPAYDGSTEEWNCFGSDACKCKDGHCILKSIVEKCVVAIDDYMNSKDSDDVSFGMQDMATTILSMLEIEECKE